MPTPQQIFIGLIALIFLAVILFVIISVMRSEDEATKAEVKDLKGAFRDVLGLRIISWSLAIMLILATLILGFAMGIAVISKNADHIEKSLEVIRWVFSSILPLLGTWVGTVIAFYFSKENFKAANDATRDLVKLAGGKLSEVKVADVMIKSSEIVDPVKVPDGKLEKVKLKTIKDAFSREFKPGKAVTRVLFVNDLGSCIGILHQSTWFEFQVIANDLDLDQDLIGDNKKMTLRSKPGTSFEDAVTKSIAFVSVHGTLADAKAAMESKPLSQDVIVTQSGASDEPMMGWISNIIISREQHA